MKNDSARNKAIDKLVGDKLRARLHGRRPGCPDAETLAAYVERTLTPAERQSWETHLAACSHCQEQVATLLRLDESERAAELVKVAPVGRKAAWFRWAMAAPVLVALVVAGLWYTGEFRPLLRQREPVAVKPAAPSGPSPVSSKSAEAAKTAALPARQELPEAAREEKETAEVAPGLPAAAAKPSAHERPGKPVASTTPADQLVSSVRGAIVTPGERARLGAATAGARLADESVAAPAPPRAIAGESKPAVEVEGKKEALAKAEAKALARAEAPSKQPTSRTLGPSVAAYTADQFAGAGNWRVSARGLIQQQADARGNWVTRTSGVDADLFAITFPSPSAGWVVGQSGTVLRTTDGGKTWRRTTSPTPEDLIQVTARSALVARVVTRDGDAFSTTDGGRTWKASQAD